MRRNHFALAVALIGATLVTGGHSETTAALTNNRAADRHLTAFIAPPFVIEHEAAYGFSIVLWMSVSRA